MWVVVLRRCVLESRLPRAECAERLRESTHRMQPALLFRRRPLVGRVSRTSFSLRVTRGRPLAAWANGSLADGLEGRAVIEVELGPAVPDLTVMALVSLYLGVVLFGVGADPVPYPLVVMGAAWLGTVVVTVWGWQRRADELVEILWTICGAMPAQVSRALG